MPAPLTPAKAAAIQACACFNLRKAARAVTQLYDEFLRPVDLRATQFSLLAVVHAMGPVSITVLADEAVMDRTTLKRNLELLEREGPGPDQAGSGRPGTGGSRSLERPASGWRPPFPIGSGLRPT